MVGFVKNYKGGENEQIAVKKQGADNIRWVHDR